MNVVEAVNWEVPELRQADDDALCSQVSVAMVLNSLGYELTPQQIAEQAPGLVDEDNNPIGTLDQQVATWCVSLPGVERVRIDTADSYIIDKSWGTGGLSPDQIVERLEAREAAVAQHIAGEPVKGAFAGDIGGLVVPGLEEDMAGLTGLVARSYAEFVRAGGVIEIHPYISSELLYKRLQAAPVIASVSMNNFHNIGRTKEQKPDDVLGYANNHTVVLTGITEQGDFHVNDPDAEYGGVFEADRDRVIASIGAAQDATDNYVWQIEK